MSRALPLAALAGIVAAGPAAAHTGVGSAHGFAAGVLHPLLGLDHLLAMVAVGLLAALAGGRHLWALPAAFVAVMVAGGALGVAGVMLPGLELWIVASVVVLGAAVAAALRGPVVIAAAAVGVFALAHGVAHGAEMPATANGLAYGAGFALATATLHAAGLGLGLGLARGRLQAVTRVAGGAIAATGLVLLVTG